jgi:acetyl-CoA synthetase
LKPGSATFPLPGIGAEVVDDAGRTVTRGGGYLTLTRPWPAMLRGIYGDPERYRQTYWSRFEGRYFAGDGAKVDDDGYFWLLGRVDDVMNVSGHRVSTTEVESALVDHPSVAEAAVVGAHDATTGQVIIAFVTLKHGLQVGDEHAEALRAHVVEKIGAIARPRVIIFTDDLPKTRSGKIMRRLLRDVAEGRDLGDTTTLADPAVVAELRRRAATGSGEE